MLDIPSPPTAGADYAIVKRALEFITKRYRDQPSIEAIADHVGLSASHFQHVFKRWAGLTPKAFLQAITIERARELLRDSASVLDAAYDVGLSGPSRLHDLFVAHEALTPGDYRRDDLILDYGFHPSPFGEAIVVATPRGFDTIQDPEIAAATRLKSMICLRPVPEPAIASPALAHDFCAFAADALPLLKWGWDALADSR